MPGESQARGAPEPPGRDWDALLKPPTVWEQLRAEQVQATARHRSRTWKIFTLIIIGAVFLGWLSLAPWAVRVPDPWNWLSIAGWFLLLPVLMFITIVILRPLERRFLRGHLGLSLES